MIKAHGNMKIALFSTEETNGGAARATNRLHLGLLQNSDVDVTFYVKNKSSDLNNIKEIKTKDKFLESIEQLVNRRYIQDNRTGVSNTLFSFSYCDSDFECMHEFDVINLHWVERFVSLNNLNELVQSGIPIVWTLHDMKPFTGGCHYSATCKEYLYRCENCEQLLNDTQELSSKVLDAKKKILEQSNITIVTPSVWLANEAKKSSLFHNKNIVVIPNSIEANIFKPMDKAEAKMTLGISPDNIVLAFGALSHTEKRKGFQELLISMNQLARTIDTDRIIALFFGNESSNNFPFRVVNIGNISDDEKLALAYNAADLFILPSLEDNFPNTILEAMSCATPVIAFDTGGVQDIVSEENGKVVPYADTSALCDEVRFLIVEKEIRIKKGILARHLIEKKYQIHHQAEAYLNLFNSLRKVKEPYLFDKLDVNADFYNLLMSVTKKHVNNNQLKFSEDFGTFFNQILALKDSSDTYVLYGYGTVGKTIASLMPEKIVGFVDKFDKKHHPKNLKSMKYDKLLITVLGREKSILADLMDIGIELEKVVTLNIEEKMPL